MNANGEQLHQLLTKLVNRVQNNSIQSFDDLLNILKCLEQIKDEESLGSDSLLNDDNSELLNTELNTECLNVDLNSESNDSTNDLTNESDSGQQSSEEGSTNDLKRTNKKCLFELILKLTSIILNHLVKQVNNKQDAELLINQWKNCICFKRQSKTLNHKINCNNCCSNQPTKQQQTSLYNLQSPTIQSSGIQSDASCSPLSSLTTDCCANLTACSLSPSCYYNDNNLNTNRCLIKHNKKCLSNSFNKDTTITNQNNCLNSNQNKSEIINSNDNNLTNLNNSNLTDNSNLSINNNNNSIPIPPPLPPPLPNQNALDKSISNSSLNNQLLINSFNSNLSSTLSPPQSINDAVHGILLDTPKPKSKMKTLNWNKISVHKVLTSHKPNIWSKLFSKKDDSKKLKQTKEDKNKKRKSNKNKTVTHHTDGDDTSEDEFKKSQRFNLTKRNKKADDNNNTTTATSNRSQSLKSSSNSSINSCTNNLNKLNSSSNISIKTESSINSTISSSSTTSIRGSKKQSEEDLMNIVKLDFETLEGLFCQPNNNQINISSVGNVGNMIANFSNHQTNNELNSCPNSPASNRRLLQQSNNQSIKLNSQIYNNQQLSYQQLNSFNQHQLLNQTNQMNQQLNYKNLAINNQTYLNNLNLNSSQINVGQLNCKLNNKLELNGRNSPNYFENSLDRKTLKRCSGEFQTDFMMHNLLDSKRSLNINIFLKQFRSTCTNDGEIEIIRLIKQGDHAVFGAEKLVHLIKLLPDQTEIELLNAHSDDLTRLPLAERFLLQLMEIPKYKLRLECLLLKAEYEQNFSYLNPSLDTLINAAKELENCRKLHEILYLILIAGNFLNSGGYAGDAAGFKMMSLLKLSEIRANKPGISLIHYVALQANKKHLSNFVNELNSVERASKISLESLKCDINSLANKIFKIKQQINSTNDCSEYWNQQTNQQSMNDQQMNTTFFQHMSEFLSDAEKQIKQLTQKVETDLEQIRTQLGEFLCEDLPEFRLEECFRIFSCFITKFRLAMEENTKRKDEFKLINSKNEQLNQSNQQNHYNLNFNSKFKKSNDLNSQFNSLPRFNQNKSSNKLFNSSNHNNHSIMNLAEENDLDPGLVEFLSKANELNGTSSDLFNGLTTFRRIGSGRRSFRQLNNLNVFANNEIDFSSRERLNINCSKITEENSKKENDEEENNDDNNEKLTNELNNKNFSDNYHYNDNSNLSNHNLNCKDSGVYTVKSLSSLSTSNNNENLKSNTPMAVIQPTLYSTSNYITSSASSINNYTTSPSEYVNNYTSKLLEKAQSQLSLNSIGNTNKVPIRSNPLTPLQTNSNGSLKRLNSGSCFGSTEFNPHNYDNLKNFKDYEDLKQSSTNLKTCIQSLESLNNITSSSRYQQDKSTLNSLTYHERTRSLSKNSSNKSPLQSLNLYNSLKRGSSERHSFNKYQVSSKVDCHNTIVYSNRNLYKENSQAKDDLLDSCKYILPKTSPVLSTLNRASILRMSLNRKAQEAKSTNSLFHPLKSPIRISTTARPINLNPKKSSHYSPAYIEPTYLDINTKTKSNSLATIKPLSRVNSFRTTLDKACHQSRATSKSNGKSVHSSSAHSNTRQPRWVC